MNPGILQALPTFWNPKLVREHWEEDPFASLLVIPKNPTEHPLPALRFGVYIKAASIALP